MFDLTTWYHWYSLLYFSHTTGMNHLKILTGSMEQILSWETKRFPASQEIPPFYGTHSFITAFTIAFPLSLSWAHTSGSILVWDTSLYFITWRSYYEELIAPHQTHNMEYYPLSAVCDCLFNIFTATLHIGGRSSICNLRTRHCTP